MRRKQRHQILIGFLGLLLVSGCGPTSKVVKNYTPVSNISGLELDQSAKRTLLYVRPGAPTLDKYDRFILDRAVFLTADLKEKKINSEDETRMQFYFKERLLREFEAAGYRVSRKPAEGTLRISFALSGIKTPTAATNVSNVVLPLPVSLSVGGITVEATFRESKTDRIDAVVISRSAGNRLLNNSPWSTWVDVEKSLDKWAKGIVEALDDANGK